MAPIHTNYNGPHTLDMTSLQGRLIDVEAGGLRGMRTDQANFQRVVLELEQAYPVTGAAAGIPQDVYDHFRMCNETVALIDQQLAVASKQLEVLRESRAFYVDARQNDISLMVDAIKSRAQRRKDESVFLSFETTIRYSSQIADKGARTRRQNAAQDPEAEPDAPDPAVQAQLEAYKAELEAQFQQQVTAAINQRLAEITAPPPPPAPPQPV